MTDNTFMDAALEYLDQGLSVIPVKQADKRPYIKWGQFQQRLPTPDELESWWSQWPDANVAIICGKVSGIFCVDADGPAGIQWMNANLPKTGVYSVTSKGVHAIYRIPEDKMVRNAVRLAPEVDIRGDGGYFVAPPSMHASGHKYQWQFVMDGWQDLADYRPPNAKGNLNLDLSATRQSPVNAPVAKGERNNTLAQLAGRWIGAGLDEAEVEALARSWNEKNSPPLGEKELLRTLASIHKTHLRNHPLDAPAAKPVPAAIIGSRQPVVKNKMPEHLLAIPGVLNTVVDYYNQSAIHPQPGFAVQTGLCVGSIVLARRFKTMNENYSSLYFLNISRAATGKEHSKTVVTKVLRKAGLGDRMAGAGYTSCAAVLSELIHKPAHLTMIDELGKYLESAKHPANSHRQEATTALMEAFGRCHGEIHSLAYSTMTSKKNSDTCRFILKPAITILAMTTPSTFYDNISVDQIKDGLLSRFLIHHSTIERQPLDLWSTKKDEPPDLTAWCQALDSRFFGNLNQVMDPEIDPQSVSLKFSPKAKEVLNVFNGYQNQLMGSIGEIEEFGGRMVEIAMRISLITALSIDPMAEFISEKATQWAVDYTRYSFEQAIRATQEHMVGSEYEKHLNEVLFAIRSTGANGVTVRDMRRQKPFRKFDKKTLEIILTDLMAGEYIALLDTRAGQPGRGRVAYVAIDSGFG
ncbi:MAG: bifunctional DNA primase/polymerase [Desulfobacteraceae bacterium]|jgi:hypothetical protein